MVTSGQRFTWDENAVAWEKGLWPQTAPEFNVVAIDYGIKRNILRLLAGEGCRSRWCRPPHRPKTFWR